MSPRERTSNPSEAQRRADCLTLLDAALAAVRPEPVTRRQVLGLLEQTTPRRLLLLGAGKATGGMLQGALAAAAEASQGGWAGEVRGVLSLPARSAGPEAGLDLPVVPGQGEIELLAGGHPLPNEAGALAARRMLELAAGTGPDDLLLVLLSGGASSLMACPAAGLEVEDLRQTGELLLASGAPIEEVNGVRKHLSCVAGGLLGRASRAGRTICLAISDVVGDDLEVVGSGPTFGDRSTFTYSLEVVERRGIRRHLPSRALARLEAGARGEIPETPRPDDPLLTRIEHRILASNLDACRAAAHAAAATGYRALLLCHLLQGEARELGRMHAALAASAVRSAVPLEPPCAVISGGEATVRVEGRGQGGRNQETCLAAVPRLEGLPATLLSVGTDGVDGPTQAAGGVVDGSAAARLRAAGIDVERALAENDSAPALAAIGAQVVTGPTGTNVADVRFLLVGSET